MKLKSLKILIIALTIISCEQSSDVNPVPKNSTLENQPSIEEIRSIAESQAPWIKSQQGGRSGRRKILENVMTLPRKGSPIMYIINYEGNGFIIIAADKRMSPILAYSEDNHFSTDQKVIPGGLLSWMSSVNETVSSIRNTSINQDETTKRIWKRYSEESILNTKADIKARVNSTIYIGDCNNGDPGYTEYTEGYVTTATWDQGPGFNDLLGYGGCSQTSNGKYWTGCVATGVAEIMRFYSHPSSYNWASMPNYGGSAEAQRLMRDLGTTGNLSMSYGCSGSSAQTDNVRRTFLNFGYSQATYSDYNIWNAKGELSNGHPILLSGRPSIWEDFTPNGHLWVAEAVQYWGYYSCSPDPNTPGEWVSVFTGYDMIMRMNWGWGGSYNGWYSASNFNPAGKNYNYGKKMIYGIRP